jgi:hypothetical protein
MTHTCDLACGVALAPDSEGEIGNAWARSMHGSIVPSRRKSRFSGCSLTILGR